MTEPRPRYVHAAIPSVLRSYVASAVAYDVEIGQPGSHIGLPSTTLTMQLASRSPLNVGWDGEDMAARSFRGMLAGLHARPARITHSGRMSGVEVQFTTAGAQVLLDARASEFAGELMDVGDLGASWSALVEQVADVADLNEQLRCVMTMLLGRIRVDNRGSVRPEVGWALARLIRGATVADTADGAGLSRRHLTTLIKAESGLPPKAFQQVARFERSYTDLERLAHRRRPSLAAIATSAGYADQAHMTREWAVLAGVTPTQWLHGEFPLLQDSAPATARHW